MSKKDIYNQLKAQAEITGVPFTLTFNQWLSLLEEQKYETNSTPRTKIHNGRLS